jgi:hypothetical protein
MVGCLRDNFPSFYLQLNCHPNLGLTGTEHEAINTIATGHELKCIEGSSLERQLPTVLACDTNYQPRTPIIGHQIPLRRRLPPHHLYGVPHSLCRASFCYFS